MNEGYLINAIRYVSLNPVRAKLVEKPADWPWSSVRAHLDGKEDRLVSVAPALERCPDFAALLEAGEDEEMSMALRKVETIG